MLLHYHISRTATRRTETVRSVAFHNEVPPTDSLPPLVWLEMPIKKASGGAITIERKPTCNSADRRFSHMRVVDLIQT